MTILKFKAKSTLLAAAVLALLSLNSCNNDFDVNADWEDITVIYGLLDPEADENWVRVQRAYLGKGPASESFDNPDSLYYDDVDVSIERYNNLNGTLGTPIDTIPLVVDYDSKQMEEGTFTTDGYRIYRTRLGDRDKITYDRDQNYIYRLVVKKPGTNRPDASSTTVMVSGGSDGFRFVAPNPTVIQARVFNGRLEWYSSANAKIYKIDMKVNYKEIDRHYTFRLDSSITIDYGTLEGISANVDPLTKIDFTKPLSYFYDALDAAFPPIPEGHLRFIKDIEFVIWAGGEDLAKYIDLNKPTLGINTNRPEFPDIENGVGMFSSRTSIKIENVALEPSLEAKYYLTPQLCDKGFAYVSSGDTCYCARIDGIAEKKCFTN